MHPNRVTVLFAQFFFEKLTLFALSVSKRDLPSSKGCFYTLNDVSGQWERPQRFYLHTYVDILLGS